MFRPWLNNRAGSRLGKAPSGWCVGLTANGGRDFTSREIVVLWQSFPCRFRQSNTADAYGTGVYRSGAERARFAVGSLLARTYPDRGSASGVIVDKIHNIPDKLIPEVGVHSRLRHGRKA